MNRQLKLIIFLFFNLTCLFCHAQKIIKAEYSGGHGCVDNSLFLYNDHTYLYKTTTAIMFAYTSKTKGNYTLSDSSITLYDRKRFHFLYFTRDKKYHSNTFRIRDNNILIYSEKTESSKDSSFARDYNTLWLVKNYEVTN